MVMSFNTILPQLDTKGKIMYSLECLDRKAEYTRAVQTILNCLSNDSDNRTILDLVRMGVMDMGVLRDRFPEKLFIGVSEYGNISIKMVTNISEELAIFANRLIYNSPHVSQLTWSNGIPVFGFNNLDTEMNYVAWHFARQHLPQTNPQDYADMVVDNYLLVNGLDSDTTELKSRRTRWFS